MMVSRQFFGVPTVSTEDRLYSPSARAHGLAAPWPVGFNYYAKGLSWDAVRGTLISTA
jgi:hypothetical protein